MRWTRYLNRSICQNIPVLNSVLSSKQFSTLRYNTVKRLGKLVTMKIEKDAFQKVSTPELNVLSDLFKKYNYEIRIAGGAVRDLLSGKTPGDIDFATTATPDQMKEMFESEKIRMINKKGEKHGTITARINDKENFEVTTLRIDIRTDGRHAEVEFTTDWQLDANRRDLTVNAMFLGLDGTLYDYFNGREDLSNRKVCFVGDAASRIQEDYLRILRYFRFYGRIAEFPDSHDLKILSDIKENANGLKDISGERLWMEMKKIVVGNFAADLLTTMQQLDILKYLGFPENVNTNEVHKIWNRCKHLTPQPMTCAVSLLKTEEELTKLHIRLKLSNDEVRLGYYIIANRDTLPTEDSMKFIKDLFLDSLAHKEPKAKDKICELLKYEGQDDLLDQFKAWEPPKFPVNGRSLLDIGFKGGPKIQKTLDRLRELWKESNYTMTTEELVKIAEEMKST
ncbi:CCA tRNA nucleotidyltransferase 1, mitochondrial-like [Tubulanus polymorphus]|uniref:CCA tRNA nucleotidyltransferase 1, mitochondrial-like n=1 Tax=Tubulanus polymorphus TaxID=672921 RepID=UPI003DA4EBCA